MKEKLADSSARRADVLSKFKQEARMFEGDLKEKDAEMKVADLQRKQQRDEQERNKEKQRYLTDQEYHASLQNKQGSEALKIRKAEEAVLQQLGDYESRTKKGHELGRQQAQMKARVAQEYATKASEVC